MEKKDKPLPSPAAPLEAMHTLAMLGLQSERYAKDAEYRDAVDNCLGIWKLRASPSEGKEKGPGASDAFGILDEMGKRLLRVVEFLQEKDEAMEIDAGWCLNRIDPLVRIIRAMEAPGEKGKEEGGPVATLPEASPRKIRCGDLIHAANGESSHAEESVFLVMVPVFERPGVWHCAVIKRMNYDGPWSATAIRLKDRGWEIKLHDEEILAMPVIGNLLDMVRERMAGVSK